MSRSPFIPLGRYLAPGLIAGGLFVVMALTFLTAGDTGPLEPLVTDAEGFSDVSIVSGIGYALLGDPAAAGEAVVYQNTESFLVALVVLAVLLDAALDGSLMLASRDEEGD